MKLKVLAINLLNDYLPKCLVGRISAWYLLHRYRKSMTDKRMIIEKEMAVLHFLLKTGDQAVDIGANVGEYTLLLAKIVGKPGKVFGFEPIPQTFNKLKSLVKIANLTNVELYNLALSDKPGKTKMIIERTLDNWWNIHAAHVLPNSIKRDSKNIRLFNVKTDTLDRIFKNCDNLQLIKCDSEGMELLILKGGKKLLHRLKPHLLIEVAEDTYHRYGYGQSDLFKFLKQLGYQPLYLHGDKVKHKWRITDADEITRINKKGTCNCFFINRKNVKNLLDAVNNNIR